MQTIKEKVDFYQKDALISLDRDLSSHGNSYESWYSELHELRRYLYGLALKYNPTYEAPYLCHSHRIDHHLYGYFAPLDFFRRGFDNRIYTPAQQIIDLAQQFAANNIRFIYVALPCKLAVYPEILLPENLIPKDGNIIPQWRKVLSEIVNAGVETIDTYPYFKAYCADNNLFSLGHDINVAGATLLGNIVGTYLQETTADIPSLYRNNIKAENVTIKGPLDQTECETSRIFWNSEIYSGQQVHSKIGIFGNCNLFKFVGSGIDITAQTSFALGYPVNYLGRLLPFSRTEGLDRATPGLFEGKQVVMYLGFPSAAYVRAMDIKSTWALKRIPNSSFQ